LHLRSWLHPVLFANSFSPATAAVLITQGGGIVPLEIQHAGGVIGTQPARRRQSTRTRHIRDRRCRDDPVQPVAAENPRWLRPQGERPVSWGRALCIVVFLVMAHFSHPARRDARILHPQRANLHTPTRGLRSHDTRLLDAITASLELQSYVAGDAKPLLWPGLVRFRLPGSGAIEFILPSTLTVPAIALVARLGRYTSDQSSTSPTDPGPRLRIRHPRTSAAYARSTPVSPASTKPCRSGSQPGRGGSQ
jgi:hypothetical protein